MGTSFHDRKLKEGSFHEALSSRRVFSELGAVKLAGNYGPAYRRLVAIKKAYDPMNLFRLNSNIRPMA